MKGRIKDELIIRDISSLLSDRLDNLRVGEEPMAEKGTAVAVKGLAELLCSDQVYSDSDDGVVCGAYWACWADWIISESYLAVRWREYALAWLNANLDDRRFGVRLPRRALLMFRSFWIRCETGWPMTRYRAVLHEDGILTTWKLEAMA